MAKKKKQPAEFRFYELPQDEPVLALMGNKWIQVYGENIDNQHFHNLLEIGLCHYGEGDLVLEEDFYRFAPGMISCIPANFLHVTRSDQGVPAFWEYLYLDPEEIIGISGRKNAPETRELIEAINRNAFFIKAEDNPILVTLVRTIFEEMENKEQYHQECVKGMAYALLHEIARFNGKSSVNSNIKASGLQLENAIDYVEQHYQDDFKIADLAQQCHMSETHFRRIFQEKMNMTPIEYVNFARVKKACELIDKTDISMEEVAEKVGFITQSTFNRNFRKIIGTSPISGRRGRTTTKGSCRNTGYLP